MSEQVTQTHIFKKTGGELLWFFTTGLLLFPILRWGLSNDEGLFAVQAVRILNGELPITDFATAYLGGNAYLFALFFKFLGESFWTLRLEFLLVSMLLGATVYHLSSQLLGKTVWAHVATLLALSISITIYPFTGAGWHALLFSLLSFSVFYHALAYQPYSKQSTQRLIACGILAGICFMMKQTIALYTGFPIFGALILEAVQQKLPSPQKTESSAKSKRNALTGLVLLLLGIPVAYLFFIFKQHLSFSNIIHFILPNALWISICASLLFQSKVNTKQVLGNFSKVVFGGVIALILFLIPYILQGKLGALSEWVSWLFTQPNSYLNIYYVPFSSQVVGNVLIVSFLLAVFAASRNRLAGIIFTLSFTFFFSQLLLSHYIAFSRGSMAILIQSCFLLGIAIMFILLFKHQSWLNNQNNQQHKRMIYMLIFGMFMMVNIYPAYLFPYFSYSVIPLVLIFIYCLQQLFRNHNTLLFAKILALLPVIYFSIFGWLHAYRVIDFTQNDFVSNPQKQFTKTLDQVAYRDRFGLKLQKIHYTSFTKMLNFIEKNVSKKTDIYFAGNEGTLYYFLAQLKNPTAYDVHQLSLIKDGSDIIECLNHYQTQYVVIPLRRQSTQPANNFKLQEKLQIYLETQYEASEIVDHYQILKRKPQSDKPKSGE